MGFNVVKVSRTEIVINGEFPADVAQGLFDKICGTQLASMKYGYDPKTNVTRLDFYPCVVQDVEYSERDKEGTASYLRERRILMTGAIPAFVDFEDNYWNAILRDAKKQKTDLRWVKMIAPKRILMPRREAMTELSFAVYFDNGRVDIDEALTMATKAVCEKLQLICRDVNPTMMTSAHLLDEISLSMAEMLHKAEDDDVAKRLTQYGLRKFDTDDMVFGDNRFVSNR